ncbi:MAG: serine/threonine protein kinase [Gemmataceae bacterium]|nr:serine/threonine protein kinase [Gemmataceae bacterium]
MPFTGRIFLGRYETRRLLGEGGMGRVYLARQTDTGREVVVKVMHEHIAADPKFRDRFERETVLMARFRHPGAVALYDASLSDPNGPCIVMEYIKGVNLEALLAKNGRMGPARVGRVVGELCEVLQAAHDEGIIHRDLKPANLMVVDPDTPHERVKVMDFGLAKLVGADPSAVRKKVTDTAVDFAVGTPGYICPEQVRGEEMDPRGDLYSVGVMMYELLTGRVPFEGTSSMDVLLAHATEPPPSFAEVGAGGRVPAEVERLVMDCLAKEPADRPQSASELAERFDTALARAEVRAERAADRVPFAEELPDTPGPRGLSAATTAVLRSPVRETTAGREADALPFFLAAWMPEAVALIKLRAFVHAAGGEVVESVPGLVRVRLGGRGSSASSSFSWFGLRRATGPLEVELHLKPADPAHPGRLSVHVLFRPAHPSLLSDQAWKDKCTQVFIELRAYLMGRAE